MKLTIRREIVNVYEIELDSEDWGDKNFAKVDILEHLDSDGELYDSDPVAGHYGSILVNVAPANSRFQSWAGLMDNSYRSDDNPVVYVDDESQVHRFPDINAAIRSLVEGSPE